MCSLLFLVYVHVQTLIFSTALYSHFCWKMNLTNYYIEKMEIAKKNMILTVVSIFSYSKTVLYSFKPWSVKYL